MNQSIMKKVGFGREVKLVKEKKCPFCKKSILLESFRDQLSIKEYRISGLCQDCQDSMFGH